MKINGRSAGRMTVALIFFMLYAAVCADKAKDAKRALPYRGMRMSGSGTVFFVTKVEHEDEHAGTAEIKIKFNIPADPRTLQKQSIRINGKPLPPDALLSFNKAGNKLKILVPASFIFETPDGKGEQFHIDLPEAKSFNQLPLYRSHLGDMRRNKEYTFIFSNPPRENPHPDHKVREKPPIDKPPRGKPLIGMPLQEPPAENPPAPYGEYLRFEEDD